MFYATGADAPSTDVLAGLDDWMPTLMPAASPAGDVGMLVDRLLQSLEDILHTAAGASVSRRLQASATPEQRLSVIAAQVEGMAPPARQILQQIMAETLRHLAEIRQIGRQLQASAMTAERSSITDALTQLLNRRGFDQLAPRAFELAQLRRGEVSLVFVDLDGMKAINDGSGHAAGDRALMAAAEALRRSFRAQDLIARWGGDEFVILSTMNPQPPDEIACRIEAQVWRLRQEMPEPPPLALSIGIEHQILDEHSRLATLMTRADAAMYLTKQARKAVKKPSVASTRPFTDCRPISTSGFAARGR